MSSRKRLVVVLSGLCGLTIAACLVVLMGASTASCGPSATNTPIRTFDRAQRTDTICLHVLDGNAHNIPAVAEPQEQCAPVPEDIDGVFLEYHLYALVTQSAKGQLAAVDLTGGYIVDTNKATPGYDFLPVGALPTDVAVTADSKWVFVPAAEPFKPAIYAIPGTAILGDSQELVGVGENAPQLTSWPVCGLPQAPGQMTIVTRPDGSYELAVVLPGDALNSAKLVTIDPTPLQDGTIAPGSLAPCTITGSVTLGGSAPTVASTTGPTWSDGIAWLDGGAPPEAVPADPVCSSTSVVDGGSGTGVVSDAGVGTSTGSVVGTSGLVAAAPHATAMAPAGTILYIGDDGVAQVHVVDVSTPGAPRELAPLAATSITTPNQPIAIKDVAVSPPTSAFTRFLYAVDGRSGTVIVYDVTDPVSSPHVPLTRPHPEVNPFIPPDRLSFSSPVAAVSFVQHDRFLQRLSNSIPQVAFKSGLICNPNPNAGLSSNLPLVDPTTGQIPDDQQLGAYYRADVTVTNEDLLMGPTRLRGIFGFVTLTDGQVVAVDVDDWDGPCRRPDPMAAPGTVETTVNGADTLEFPPAGPRSAVAPVEPPASSSTDYDPYHVPVAFTQGSTGASSTTLESFFPVSAPHRSRSMNYLRNDPTYGIHQPYLNGIPQLFEQAAPLPTSGTQGLGFPLILPTDTAFVDPTYQNNPVEPDPAAQTFADAGAALAANSPTAVPGVRLAWEDPQVQVDQDWLVTYEGQLPSITTINQLPGVTSSVGTTVDVTFSIEQPTPGDDTKAIVAIPAPNGIQLGADAGAQGGALFCRLGVEDRRLGLARAQAADAARAAAGLPADPTGDNLAGDYVQIEDDLLSVDDPYWSEPNSCWDPGNDTASQRWISCNSFYGLSGDQSIQRDFPIVEAYDDHLVIGRYAYPQGVPPSTSNRTVVGADPSNAAFLRQARCCFHGQSHMAVRTGGEWVTTGSVTGYLHHIVAEPGTNACVPSCDPRQVLLESRSLGLPRPIGNPSGFIDRNSPLAMRNPMFSFLVYSGVQTMADGSGNMVTTSVTPARDIFWKFTTRGEFVPLTVNIAATDSSVDPQSMHFIPSLGQLAVIDGADQGLVLIDLNTVAFAHAPYF